MVDPNKVRGETGRPYGPEPEKDEKKVDPEKFKKVMRVDETDPSQKRHKRQLKKEEEEGDEKVDESSPPHASHAFSEFMEDKKEVDNLFAPESAGIKKRAAPESQKKAPETDSILKPESPSTSTEKPPSSTHEKTPEPITSPEKETDEHFSSHYTPKEEKKKESDASLLSSQVGKDTLKSKKKEKPEAQIEFTRKPPETEKKDLSSKKEEKNTPADAHELKKDVKKPKNLPADEPAAPVNHATFKRFTPEEIKQKKLHETASSSFQDLNIEGLPPLPKGEGTQDFSDQKHAFKEDDFPFIQSEQLTTSFPTIQQPLASITPAETPAYAHLSSEVFELFEKLAGTILIQHHSGVTSTTVTINMPNSIFNGSQVILEHYSTAPHSYNLQLVGSSQAVEAFNMHLDDLAAAFKQGQFAFEVNILRPSLPIKKPLVRRKGSANKGKR